MSTAGPGDPGNAIPFDAIRDTALSQADRLLRDWFPQGRIMGREFKIGNVHGDAGESLSVNIGTGRWADFAADQSGYDLIDLRAQMRHGGDRVAAAREMGEALGIRSNGHDPKPDHFSTRPATDWHPSSAPPPGTPRPDQTLARFDRVHEYTNATDCVTHYVGRIEAKGRQRKQFVPVTWGTLDGVTGWHAKAPASLRPLYGINRLASAPDASVIVCEGEKAADAAQRMFPDRPCISWMGGAGSVKHADLAPLRGRNVIIWPDNDPEGAKAAAELLALLPGATVLRVDDLPKSADAADVAPADPEAWLADRLPPAAGDPLPGLRDFLAIEAWADREMPPADRLLGDLVTTTTRMFLVGRTGLGKTLLALALATGMANGDGFMHWRSSRPARVLVIDGEMPGELIRQRAIEALRRAGMPPPPGNLMIYARDMEDDFAARFPTLGRMPPLNTEGGRNWVLSLLDQIGGVDVVIFDNVMSLIGGDQKDEVPWTETLPLVQALTGRRVGQVWLDHTGHNQDRQYGSSTKAWRFDAVGIMAPLPEDQKARNELAFTLSFDHPGKARRRTPDNWQDFQACTIRLADDRWTSEPASKAGGSGRGLSPTAQMFHRALLDALAVADPSGKTTRAAWYAECVRTGLATAIEREDDHRAKEAKRFRFRKYLTEIRTAGLIGVDGEAITDLRRGA